MIPRAVGSASRLNEEAAAYKAGLLRRRRATPVVRNSIQRSTKRLRVTQDHVFWKRCMQIYGNVTSSAGRRQGSNCQFAAALDKIMQGVAKRLGGAGCACSDQSVSGGVVPGDTRPTFSNDSRR